MDARGSHSARGVHPDRHLQAVFAPISRVAADPEIGRLFEWCKNEGVDRVPFNASRGDDFDTLRRVCVDYIRRKLQ